MSMSPMGTYGADTVRWWATMLRGIGWPIVTLLVTMQLCREEAQKKRAPEARGPDGSWILPMVQREYATVYTSCSASKTAEEVKEHRYWK